MIIIKASDKIWSKSIVDNSFYALYFVFCFSFKHFMLFSVAYVDFLRVALSTSNKCLKDK